jgi:hypothetical protein
VTGEAVLRLGDVDTGILGNLLGRFGLTLTLIPDREPIPGSWWGESEAGLKAGTLFARADTPVHSVLHEACHFVCMTPSRRLLLDTDAGGDYDEENGVCYLQVLLADHVPGMSRTRMFSDMDAWGYGFRLGSARAWFTTDAEDAREWLVCRGLVGGDGCPTWCCRGEEPDRAA